MSTTEKSVIFSLLLCSSSFIADGSKQHRRLTSTLQSFDSIPPTPKEEEEKKKKTQGIITYTKQIS
jgi:hypothetical protein